MKNILKQFRKSLSYQISILSILSYLVIAIVIGVVVYTRFESRMINDYTRMAEGLTTLMADAYDTARTDEFIEKNFQLQEYRDLVKYYHTLKDNYPDVYYMYIYRFDSDEPLATVVIDLDEEYSDTPPQESVDWIGETYEVDGPFASEVTKISQGKEAVFHTVHTQDNEYLLSYVRPITDADGNYSCSACVDFSMDYLHKQDINFMIQLMGILLVIMIVILYFNLQRISKQITSPLDLISSCIDSFVYETETDRFNNIHRLEELNISADNEIGLLFNSFVANMKESLYYMSNYNKAKDEIVDKEKEIEEISQMTYVDGLTHAKNKAAYLKAVPELDAEIRAGLTEVGVIMADVNNLKYVNDTFGHDAGDEYLNGSCKVLCNIFKHSPVFRTGGDEFLIILQGQDYDDRNELLEEAKNSFIKSFNDESLDPWKRYSASLGMDIYKSEDTIGDIVKRADKKMYDNKMNFKKQYGSYR